LPPLTEGGTGSRPHEGRIVKGLLMEKEAYYCYYWDEVFMVLTLVKLDGPTNASTITVYYSSSIQGSRCEVEEGR